MNMNETSLRGDDVSSSAARLFFEDALGVASGVFLDEISEQRHHGPHRAAAHLGAAGVATLADVDYLLNHAGQRPRQVQLVENGSPIHDPNVIDRNDRVNVAYLYERFCHGASLRILHVHHPLPQVAAFCRQLATALAVKVTADAYISPAGGNTLRPVYYDHDVIALQCVGHQGWRLFAPDDDTPRSARRLDADSQPGAWHQPVLAPGDMLYVPRGMARQATNDDVSLHLAFGIQAPTWGELALRALRSAIEEDIALRTAVPCAIRVDPSAADDAVVPAVVRTLMAGRVAGALGGYQTSNMMAPARHWFSSHHKGVNATERLQAMIKERIQLGVRRRALPQRRAAAP